ncbi:hypothetical protein G5B37_13405 [Rasiella rasia]|uniref:Lipoprotein n=1 Tax=Rasiella rasia TaxID=2744027 RepID=A0A6G6GPJ9_9FLAO|nr:hypothetical protein [Rasiella rasia]QIE60525.1 hypothetical protein G5B37_13405 [Rasiella rasia]
MKQCKHLFAFICICAIAICSSSCKSSDTKDKEIVDNSVTIRLRSLTDIKLQNPTAVVTLYGYDEAMADTKASVVARKTVSLTAVPLDVVMAIPKKPESMINPKPLKASYYLAFYCDANKNNIEDEGDLILDSSKGLNTVILDSKDTQVYFLKSM